MDKVMIGVLVTIMILSLSVAGVVLTKERETKQVTIEVEEVNFFTDGIGSGNERTVLKGQNKTIILKGFQKQFQENKTYKLKIEVVENREYDLLKNYVKIEKEGDVV